MAFLACDPHPLEPPCHVAIDIGEALRCVPGAEVLPPPTQHGIERGNDAARILVTARLRRQLLHALLHPLYALRRRPALKEVHASAFLHPDRARHAFVQVTAEEVEALLSLAQIDSSRLFRV